MRRLPSRRYVRNPFRRWTTTILVLCLVTILRFHSTYAFRFSSSKDMPNEDPYKVLGVSRLATLHTIRQKYRRLAKEHHPDKGGQPNRFASIANAYEILSDDTQRRRYDQQSNFGQGQRQRQRQPSPRNDKQRDAQRRAQQHQKQHEEATKARQQKRSQRLQAAKVMQNHLLRAQDISHLIDLGILTSSQQQSGYFFAKHFFGVFVGGKKQEKTANDDFLFPYPYSGEGRNGILWQDVLQTVKIRFNKRTDLVEHFKIPTSSSLPTFVFGKAGDPMTQFHTFQQKRVSTQEVATQLEEWVHAQLTVRIQVINRHHSHVKIFRVTESTTTDQQNAHTFLQTLPQGHVVSFAGHVTDKFIVVDARVDAYPGGTFQSDLLRGVFHGSKQTKAGQYSTNLAVLGEFLVGLEPTIEVLETHCLDLSLKCSGWTLDQKKIQCHAHPEFMHSVCPASCGICMKRTTSTRIWGGVERRMQEGWFSLRYTLQQAPISRWPTFLRGPVQFFRFFVDDLSHVWYFRRTIVTVFFVLGATFGVHLFLLPNWLLGGGLVGDGVGQPRLTYAELMVLTVWTGVIIAGGWLVTFASPNSWALRRDWDHVWQWHMDAFYVLLTTGFVGSLTLQRLFVWARGSTPSSSSPSKGRILQVVVTTFLLVSMGLVSILLYNDTIDSKASRHVRWWHLWFMRKNITAVMLGVGILSGVAIEAWCKVLWRFRDGLVAVVLDILVVLTLDWVSVSDPHFWKDFEHVVALRMSAAIPFGIVGILVGFGTPIGILEYMEHNKSDLGGVQKRLDLSC